MTSLAGSESCIRLVDVDGDGRDDVIFGMQSDEFPIASVESEDEMKKLCLVASMYKKRS